MKRFDYQIRFAIKDGTPLAEIRAKIESQKKEASNKHSELDSIP